MESILYGFLGGVAAHGCIYLYNRATRKHISSERVIDIVINTINRNKAMRNAIRGVR